jgi:DNA-binding GntR family transcriptional regulator
MLRSGYSAALATVPDAMARAARPTANDISFMLKPPLPDLTSDEWRHAKALFPVTRIANASVVNIDALAHAAGMKVSGRKSRNRAPAAAPSVFEQLRDMIVSLTLVPGTPLSRSALQRQFKLSSTPIRDALMRLQEVALVEVFPQSGTIVSLIDVPKARQSQFLRRSIEQEIVRVLAAMPDAGLVDRLRAIVAEQRRSAKDQDLGRFNELDLAFHKTMYDAANVPDLWAVVRKYSGHIDRIRRLHLPIGNKAAQIIRDHSAIIAGIATGEPDRAQSELRDHLSRSIAFTDELRSRFPGYFKD